MHKIFMRDAIDEAKLALAAGEVPVGGAVVVWEGGRIVGRGGRNRREEWNDPTAHAEMLAIREAAKRLGRWRLTGAAIYVTLEPCPPCAPEQLSTPAWIRLSSVPMIQGGGGSHVFDESCAG